MKDTSNTGKVLQAVMGYWRENAIPPPIRFIQTVTGIRSTSVVRYHYKKLEKTGAIIRIKGKPVPIQIYTLIRNGEPSR